MYFDKQTLICSYYRAYNKLNNDTKTTRLVIEEHQFTIINKDRNETFKRGL